MTKEKIITAIRYIFIFTPLIATCIVVLSSLDWGLPNRTINNIVLPEKESVRKKVVSQIVNTSKKSIENRASVVIETPETDIVSENLRIARRYLLYSENPDEMIAMGGLSGINPKKLQFKPKCFNYGGGYIYPMGAMIAAGRILQGKKLNVSIDNILNEPDEIASFYIWGRALNVIIILLIFAGLLLIFYSQNFSCKVALFASSIIVSSPVIINWATILKPHLTGTAFFILAAGTILVGVKRNKLKKYFFISMCLAAYACSAQYFMITAGIIPCLILLQDKALEKKEKIKAISLGILMAGIVFFIFNPYHLFNINNVLVDLKRGKDYYSPSWFNIKIPFFALWMWFIGTGFTAIPLLAALFNVNKVKSFIKKYNYFIICILFFGYYLSALCISLGFTAITTRFFIPIIILVNVLLLVRINEINNKSFRKIIFCFLFFASLINIHVMRKVLDEGKSSARAYIEASKYLNNIHNKYDTVFSSHITPAPYITPACSINCNITPWKGELKDNELLVSNTKIEGLRLIKSFNAKNRYFKISFAEKDFYFYIKSESDKNE